MGTFIIQAFGNIVRWVIYLVIIGEVSIHAMDLKEKAHHSVKTGLISIQKINNSLHR